jgi:N-acylglucosamine-6-phosphate 2-epimerase
MAASRTALLNHLRGQLVVSCQAAAGSPLEETSHIVALARAAVIGGGRGVRIESVANVTAVRLAVDAPIIGIVKARHPDTDVFITATSAEVVALANAGADIIAFDATRRPRPELVAQLNSAVHARGRIAVADISTLDEAKAAIADGADFVGTTLSGYTPYSPSVAGPDFELLRQLGQSGLPFVAEGRIGTPEEARQALELGASFVVVGSAITRPDVITRRFADAIAALRPCALPQEDSNGRAT